MEDRWTILIKELNDQRESLNPWTRRSAGDSNSNSN